MTLRTSSLFLFETEQLLGYEATKPMIDLIIKNGTILTQDEHRNVIEDGGIALDDGTIVDVGSSDRIEAEYSSNRELDATGKAVVPGFINAHVHVSDVLLRGSWGTDRTLYDWLFNIKRPGVAAMELADHEIAAALFCAEAIQSGVTTFVENDAEMPFSSWGPIEAKLDAYETAGIRAIYARGFSDIEPDEDFEETLSRITAKEPGIEHPPPGDLAVETDEGLADVEKLIQQYDGAADGRLGIWIAPVVLETTTTEALQRAVEIANRHDVMTTTHVAESEIQERGRDISSIEYLNNIGYLGDRTILAHCVQVTDRDIRLLARTDTRVSHNILANLVLGSGIAPVPEMIDKGVTVCLGTDNTTCSDTVNPVTDVRFAATVHKGINRDPGLLPAQKVLDMVTIDAAKAIRRGDELGSIEPGKLADLSIFDLDHPHLTPAPELPSALVYQAQGFEISTVICNGEIVMRDREIVSLSQQYPDLLEDARAAASDVLARSGISSSV